MQLQVRYNLGSVVTEMLRTAKNLGPGPMRDTVMLQFRHMVSQAPTNFDFYRHLLLAVLRMAMVWTC